MKYFCGLWLFCFIGIGNVIGNTIKIQVSNESDVILEKAVSEMLELEVFTTSILSCKNEPEVVLTKDKSKAVAITLAVTLGVFGVHRLYLGTSNKVPIIYTLTLGGGFGFLMVSDIVAIAVTPDINTFSPNEKVFMWAK